MYQTRIEELLNKTCEVNLVGGGVVHLRMCEPEVLNDEIKPLTKKMGGYNDPYLLKLTHLILNMNIENVKIRKNHIKTYYTFNKKIEIVTKYLLFIQELSGDLVKEYKQLGQI